MYKGILLSFSPTHLPLHPTASFKPAIFILLFATMSTPEPQGSTPATAPAGSATRLTIRGTLKAVLVYLLLLLAAVASLYAADTCRLGVQSIKTLRVACTTTVPDLAHASTRTTSSLHAAPSMMAIEDPDDRELSLRMLQKIMHFLHPTTRNASPNQQVIATDEVTGDLVDDSDSDVFVNMSSTRADTLDLRIEDIIQRNADALKCVAEVDDAIGAILKANNIEVNNIEQAASHDQSIIPDNEDTADEDTFPLRAANKMMAMAQYIQAGVVRLREQGADIEDGTERV
ncbi:hypothetical protein BDW22DRAFT_381793 [Trametopsis cervina]|nr:hypothetical protein BDW22DRAFT_381793 [Trametopsis cervina]